MRPWLEILLSSILCACGPLGEEGGSASGNRPASEDNSAAPVSVNRELLTASITKVSCPADQFILYRNGKIDGRGQSSQCNFRDGSNAIDINCSSTDKSYTPLLMINAEGSTDFNDDEILDARFTISDWTILGLTPEETAGCEASVKIGGGEFGQAIYKVLRTKGQVKRGNGKYLFGFVLGSLCSAIKEHKTDEMVACFSK